MDKCLWALLIWGVCKQNTKFGTVIMLKIFVNSYFHTHKNLCEQLKTAWIRKIARLHIQYKTISDMCVYAEPSQRH